MKRHLIFLLCALMLALTVSAQDEPRAAAAWRVGGYDITARVPQDPADRYLSVKAVLNLQNSGNASGSRLTLRISDKAEVAAVQVNGATGTFTKGEEKLTSARNLQRIVVSLPAVAPGASFTVGVDYRLKVEENSGLNALSPAGSQFLPLSFWYPTPTTMFAVRGADYAPFKLKVEASTEDVISSGRRSATGFDQKLNGQPFFMAGAWDELEGAGDSANITVFMPKGAGPEERAKSQELLNLAAAARSYVSGIFGVSPDSPLRIVFARRGAGFTDGGTVLLDAGAFRRKKIDPQLAMTIAEAVAKTHLGNLVSVRGEGYGVIREGLSRYLATQFLEKQYGKEAADAERLRHSISYAAISKRDGPLSQASPIDDYYFTEMANKGSMVWRILAATGGNDQMFGVIRSQSANGNLTLANLRAAFSAQKELLDYLFDQVTDMNLMAGLPRQQGGEVKAALRNLGGVAADVNVVALTDKGEKLVTKTRIEPRSFGEVTFKTTQKIVRVEIDPEKLYPQTDYSDDAAPREFTETDPVLIIKRSYDKQDYSGAEKAARAYLNLVPMYTDVKMWLGRALLAQGRTPEADKVFKEILEDKLPTSRAVAWANVGLGDIAARTSNSRAAADHYVAAIRADAEYGASLAARAGRAKLGLGGNSDQSAVAFFSQFDKAAVSNKKAELDALIVPGEIVRFSAGIAGQAEQWKTQVINVEKIDDNNLLVETALSIKMLSKEPESGTAVFQLTRSGAGWRLAGVDIFELRPN